MKSAYCPRNIGTSDHKDWNLQLELAKTTTQEFEFHQEGDVRTHTNLVVEALLGIPAYQALQRADQEVVFLAALLHDVAKCSDLDPVTGRIGQLGHSRKGAIDARIALWDAGAPFHTREAACRLIQVHQLPFFALEGSRSGKTPEYLVCIRANQYRYSYG